MIKHFTFPYISNFIKKKPKIKFTEVVKNRELLLSNRVGLSHTRPSVVFHRKAINNILQKYGCDSKKVSLRYYFDELKSSKIGVSPFGVGEITLRDFEIIICGAMLLKPTMEHMITWPNLFIPDETYIPHRWDLSNIEDKIDMLKDDENLRENIAFNAQCVYKAAISESGLKDFANRIKKIIPLSTSWKEIK